MKILFLIFDLKTLELKDSQINQKFWDPWWISKYKSYWECSQEWSFNCKAKGNFFLSPIFFQAKDTKILLNMVTDRIKEYSQ